MRRLAPFTVVLVVAGCGGDEVGYGSSERSVTVPAGGELRVVGTEYRFEPERVVVQRAGRLVIVLENRGSLAHNLKLFRGDTQVGGTPTFQGGRTESGSVVVERGRYRMVCTVGEHAELGMVGELAVR